jgi:acyl-CoA thioester hydrolase
VKSRETPTEDGTAVEHRVDGSEVDKMGVATYGRTAAWFALAREEVLRARGISRAELEAEGCRLPVVETFVRVHAPAECDELVRISAEPIALEQSRVTFAYRVVGGAGEGALLAEGTTIQACVSKSGRPRPLPRELLELLKRPSQSG